MNRPLLAILAAALAVFFAGCGSVPRPLPGAHQTARELNVSGNKAYNAGDYGKALELYGRALGVCLSIDDREGAAMNRFNIAATHHRQGDDDAALESLAGIIESGGDAGHLLRAKAAYLSGVIHLSAGDTGAAIKDAGLASNECAESDGCGLSGKILNLKARIAIGSGMYPLALEAASKALNENESAADMPEVANSHRIIGDAHSHMGNMDEALARYESALYIDKELGLPDKVGRDIESIGTTLCRSGRHVDARKYFKRARTAYQNAGLTAGYETSNELLNVCYKHPDQ